MSLNYIIIEKIIKENYDLGRIQKISPLDSGHESDNVRVKTTKGEFVVKYFSQSAEHIRRNAILQYLLSNNGVKLPFPIKTLKDDFIVEYSSTETILIQSFVHGEAIADRFNTPEKMYSLMSWFGQQIGEFHYISKSIIETDIRKYIDKDDFFDISKGFDWIHEQYINAETLLPPHEKNSKILKEYTIFRKEIEEVFDSKITKGIIQNDLKPGDFFVIDKELTGILDFNGAAYSYLMDELGTWVMYTSLHKPENKKYFQDFITAYLEYSKISIQELKLIPLFLKARAFVQYFYFAYRIYNEITQGLDKGETNYDGFEDGIRIVEDSLKIQSMYFYDLAISIQKI